MKKAILELLIAHKGQHLSGEDISRKLSVTRTAVWKHIKTLKEEGYRIDSLPKSGYRLVEQPDVISPEEIQIGLNTALIGRPLYVFDRVDSTNDLAKRLAAEGKPEGTVVIADEQSKGKGRIGRRWVSQPGVGLYFSLILRPRQKPSLAPQLVFVGAVAVCRGIRRATGLDVSIKWPNDLFCDKKKISGVLTELSAEIDLINYIVMGIGVNVNQGKQCFSGELQETATSLLLAAGRPFRRVEVLQAILEEIEREYRLYQERGFAVVLDHWRELNATLGREVNVLAPDGQFSGTAFDVDEEGRLMVRTPAGETQKITVGDVSIREKS